MKIEEMYTIFNEHLVINEALQLSTSLTIIIFEIFFLYIYSFSITIHTIKYYAHKLTIFFPNFLIIYFPINHYSKL